MSTTTTKYIWGVRITLDTEKTQDTDIGLYTAGGVSQFRWVLNSTSATTDTWKAGMFTEDGIGRIPMGADFSIGGNTAMVKPTEVSVRGSIGTTPFWKKLADAEISLKGCIAEIVEIDTETAHGGTRANETILYRGACLAPSGWNEGKYTIPIEPTYYKRIANITSKVDNDPTNGNYPNADDSDVGKAVPATFGQIGGRPATDSSPDLGKAKLIRTASKTYALTNDQIMNGVNPAGIYIFPIVSDQENSETHQLAPTLEYDIKIGTSATTAILADLNGKFIQVIEGAGSGQIRRITSTTITPNSPSIRLTVASYFQDTLQGNATATKRLADNPSGEYVQSWVKIMAAASDYTGDTWACDDFIGSSGESLGIGIEELYSYAEQKNVIVPAAADLTSSQSAQVKELAAGYIRLPRYAYQNSSANSNNQLNIVAELFNGDFDSMDSFLILPMKSVAEVAGNSSDFGDTLYNYNYGHGIHSDLTGVQVLASPSSLANIIGYDGNAKCTWSFQGGTTNPASGNAVLALDMELPEYPGYFDFDSCYLMLQITAEITAPGGDPVAQGDQGNFSVYFKRFMGKTGSLTDHDWDRIISYQDDIPDFYFESNIPETKNRNFWVVEDSTTSTEHKFYGYTQFPLDFANKDIYNAIHKMGIRIRNRFTIGDGSHIGIQNITINKLGVIFKKSVSIKEAIYSPMKGRTWKYPIGSGIIGDDYRGEAISVTQTAPPVSPSEGDVYWVPAGATGDWAGHDNTRAVCMPDFTWYFAELPTGAYLTVAGTTNQYIWDGTALQSARKSGLVMIENPVEVYEHIARLQDWKETGDTEDFGKAYSPNALINTGTTEGGFDWVGLDSVRAMKAARQILEYDDCYTDRIMESLCRQYFLCGYQNPTGEECINTIHPIDGTPEVSLTLADIVPGSISDVEEVSPRNIFCEPEINFKKNYGSGKFDGHITVKRVEAATFDPSYVTGFSGADGEAELIWNMCHALYSHYRVKTRPHPESTDCEWIRTLDDAKLYLKSWLRWMGAYTEDNITAKVAIKKRLSFRVPYELSMTIGSAHTPWFPSMHFEMTLLHQTNNVTTQGIIEDIEFDVNSQETTVKAILYDVPSEINFYVQDTYNTAADRPGQKNDWQKTYLTKAENPANENDIQDSQWEADHG